jgi:hypothetical protein
MAFGVVVIAGILLAGSPNAPDAMKRHLPWRGQLEAQAVPVGTRHWPDGEVPYSNAVPEQAEALAWAVRAWNESGADVRFRAVPRDQAKLVITRIEHGDCSLADASVGHVPGSQVRIFRIDPTTPGCDRYNAARALAHELGHVLGLDHEEHRCAAMNPAGSLRGSEHCAPTPPGTWACRLLEPTDVERAIDVYGGELRPARGPRACPVGDDPVA